MANPTPPYIKLSNGDVITFEKSGPKLTAVLSNSEGVLIRKGNSLIGSTEKAQANTIILEYPSPTPTIIEEVLAPPKPPPPPPPPPTEIEYSIKGKIVDSTNPNKNLPGVKISLNIQNDTTSNSNGEFTLKGKTTPDKKISVSVSLKGYTPQNFIPYYGDGTIKSDLGVIQLQLIEKSLEQDKIDSTLLTDSQINGLTKSIKTSSSFLQKKLTTSIINVKSRLIPLILTLIAGFGVTQVNKFFS